MPNLTPLEDLECYAFADWLHHTGLTFTHIANGQWQPSWKQRIKYSRIGVRRGFPDYVVIIPQERSIHSRALLLAIEMKRIKGGKVEPEQIEWQRAINQIEDCQAFICRGADEAISTVSSFLHERIGKKTGGSDSIHAPLEY